MPFRACRLCRYTGHSKHTRCTSSHAATGRHSLEYFHSQTASMQHRCDMSWQYCRFEDPPATRPSEVYSPKALNLLHLDTAKRQVVKLQLCSGNESRRILATAPHHAAAQLSKLTRKSCRRVGKLTSDSRDATTPTDWHASAITSFPITPLLCIFFLTAETKVAP